MLKKNLQPVIVKKKLPCSFNNMFWKRRENICRATGPPDPASEIEQFEDETIAKKRIQSLILIDNDDLYLCRFCEQTFNNKKDILKHLKIHKPFACVACPKRYDGWSFLRAHAKYHGERNYACDFCDKKYFKACELKCHLMSHSGEKPYKCNICDFRCNKRWNLTKHKTRHTGEKPHECDVCHLKFNCLWNLTRHKTKHTGERPYECDVCHRKFREKFPFQIHLRTHTGEKPFQCHSCGKRFTTKNELKYHLIKHDMGIDPKRRRNKIKKEIKSEISDPNLNSDEKPYQCTFCERTFSAQSYLVIHTRTHTGVKPFECDICLRKFAVKSILIQHLRIHTGEKPFECKVCSHKFRARYSLERHIRTHTGEKPYECTICQRMFSSKPNLQGHLRSHSSEKRTNSRSRSRNVASTMRDTTSRAVSVL